MNNSLHPSEKIRKHRILFLFTFIAIVSYIVWRMFYTLPTRYGVVSLLCGILMLLAEMSSSFEGVVNYAMMSHYIPPELPELPKDWYPEVDIFIATHNEPVSLLYNTINGCTFLDYPDKSKVHIHLCDDNARPEMEALAREMGIRYWGLANNRDAKGGNLNNAMRQTNAPICVTLDADMIPRHEFLMKSVPYFFLPKLKKDRTGRWIPKEPNEIDPEEKVGFVQTPQGFYNPDLFQYNLYSEGRYPGEQDMFFQEINVARSAYNAAIYAGSNTLIAREALEDVDYIAVDTITEDILTGIRIQKLGYRCYATSEVLAQGQSPITIKSLIKQRERWGRGCVDTFRQEPILFSKYLSFAQKASYLASYVFWWNYLRRFAYTLSPIITILFSITVLQSESTWVVLAFWLPYYLLFNRSLRVMSGNLSNQHWNGVADTVLFPYLIGPIIAEQAGIKQKTFVITEKQVTANKARSTFAFGLPHLVFLCALVASIVVVIVRSVMTGTIHSPLILFWLVISTKNIIFALFFMWGRDNYRLASRFFFSEPITVSSSQRVFRAVTSDVSETGLAFYFDDPQFIPEDTPLTVTIAYRDREIILTGKLVHIAPSGQRWKYSIHFDEMQPEDKRYYIAFVYDRAHSLPKAIDPSVSLLDDFNFRLGKRATPVQESMRKLPRVRLDIPFAGTQGDRGMLVDFNYRYATVQMEADLEPGQILQLHIAPALTLLLERDSDSKPCLFRVLGSEQYATDEAVAPLLTGLAQKSPREKDALKATALLLARLPGRGMSVSAEKQHRGVAR